MRRYLLLGLVALFSVSLLRAVEPRKRFTHRLNLALTLPSQSADSVPTAFHLGLLSNLYSQRGVGLELLSNVVETDARGVQLSGLLNVAGRRQSGLQLSALMNHGGQHGSGAQVGLLVNAARRYDGLQLATLSNVSVVHNGLQLSTVNNVVCETLRGAQITSVANIAVRVSGGLQLAGLVNVAQDEMRGLQTAVFNYAGNLRGWQVGVVNVSDRKKGWQIGLVNYSKSPSHRKIGLVNIDSLTRVQFVVSGGNTAKAGGGVRLLGRLLYTQFGIGTQWIGLDEKFSGCLYYRRGLLLPLSRHLRMPLDLGFAHIESFDNAAPDTPERMYGLQARAGLEWAVTPHLNLQAMGGYGVTRPYDRDASYERKALVEVSVIFQGR